MKILLTVAILLFAVVVSQATPPPVVNVQGRAIIHGENPTGPIQMKFAIGDKADSVTYWRNDGDPVHGEPADSAAITTTAKNGIFSVLLGDESIENMHCFDTKAFEYEDVYLRIWVSDGTEFQRLLPDRPMVAAPYAVVAHSVADGIITSAKIAAGAITSDKVQKGAIGPLALANNAVGENALAEDSVTSSKLAGEISARKLSVSTLRDLLEDLGYEPGGGQQNGVPPGAMIVSNIENDPKLLEQGYLPAGRLPGREFKDEGFRPPGLDGPTVEHTLVWGDQMLLFWGGKPPGEEANPRAGGQRIFPNRNHPHGEVERMSAEGEPSPRWGHSAVWTGNRMLVWGGFAGIEGDFLGYPDGGSYDPAADTWSPIQPSDPDLPAGRGHHSAVWTGSRMLIWGGSRFAGDEHLNSGAEYDPDTSEWAALPDPPEPLAGRRFHSALWTGSKMLIWGGETIGLDPGFGQVLDNGAVYNFESRTWQMMAAGPSARRGHSAVWTGSEMFIWGGEDAVGAKIGDGFLYDPASGTWRAVSTEDAPLPRAWASTVWSGDQVILLGGTEEHEDLQRVYFYSPRTDTWTRNQLNELGEPSLAPRGEQAVWTGSEMLISNGSEFPHARNLRIAPQVPPDSSSRLR